MTRTRRVHQQQQHGGKSCPDLVQARVCNTKPCPVDCEVGAWNAWSK